jgi:peptidyl-prolyl cis-trans isomerase SurA
MRRYRKYLLLFFLVWERVASAGQGFLIDKVVAVVNDDVITLSELQKEGKPLIQRIRQELEGEAQASQVQITQRQILQALILRRLQLQEAGKEGIVVEASDVDATITMIKERNGLASDKEFTEVLAKENLTLDEFRTKVREQIVVDRLLTRHVRTRIVVSEEEITAYYQAHIDDFDQSPSVRIRHVLIHLPRGPLPRGCYAGPGARRGGPGEAQKRRKI